jgi:hypothetical protein
MTNLHESTQALSVYNALLRFGAMRRDQIHTKLREFWRSDVEAHEVNAGIRYLLERKFVEEQGEEIKPAHYIGARPQSLRRSANVKELALQ